MSTLCKMIAALNKTVYFVLVFSILFTVSEGESWKCNKRSGKFPIPGSCTSYYVCGNFKVVSVETCPPDEHYNPIKEWCDWKELYPCLEKPKHKECPKLNGRFLKNGTDCERYFDCCNGEPTEKKCPKGLLFDAESGKCDYEELVDCDGRQKEKCPKPTGRFLKSGTECKVYYDCYKGQATEKLCPKYQLFDTTASECVKKELVTCKDREDSSESSSSESNESSKESTANDKISSPSTFPDTISERFISDSITEEVKSPLPFTDSTTEGVQSPLPFTDSTTEGVQSPLPFTDSTTEKIQSPLPFTDSTTEGVQSPHPFTDSTTEDIESPLPTTDDISKEVSYSTENEITRNTTSDLQEKTTLASQTPEIRFESSTQAIVSTPQNTAETTNRQITDEDLIITRYSPKITEPTSHPTELISDSPTILDLTSTPQEETLITDSTAESSPELSTGETTVDEILSSTYLPTENPEVSTSEETSDNYQTELPSSHGTSETVSEDIFTDSEQFSSSVKTTQTSNTDTTTDTTRETVEISIETTTETITSLETKSSTSDAYQSTIDPVLVGFVCPEQTGYYPHPTNRRKFIGCVHGNAYIMDCPSNLVYNHDQRRCVYNN